MKGSSNILQFIHALKQADTNLEVFQLEHPGSAGARMFTQYRNRIQWIFKDIITNPWLPKTVTDGIKKEIESDVFATSAIQEKAALITPEEREMIELIMDKMLDGEEITIELNSKEKEAY